MEDKVEPRIQNLDVGWAHPNPGVVVSLWTSVSDRVFPFVR